MKYVIIQSIVLENDKLNSTDKLLMGIITSLTYKNEYCYASNSYFSKILNVSKRTITSSLSKLKKEKLIKIIYDENQRKIYNMVWKDISMGIEDIFYTP